jgi:uncharacterized membrane protein YfcA
MVFDDPIALGALLALIFLAAVLYSSVGHGGASGYLAAMALLGVAPAFMKPAALAMNVAVAGLVSIRLWRAGYFDARLFWPFATASIPLAFVGGALSLPGTYYRTLVGVALLLAGARLLWKTEDREPRAHPATWQALASGAGLGFLSGLTGVGGGIFLSPLLLFLGWANMRTTAAISAAFILVNSIAGLAGHAVTTLDWPPALPWMLIASFAGALLGSEMAVRRAAPTTLKRVLGVVLLVAAAKMIMTA